jgi:hypothetical protein
LTSTVPSHSFAVRSLRQQIRRPAPKTRALTGSKEAGDEIQTYAAIRDLLVSDAEVTTTAETLRRAAIANDFVETCLGPPRVPYEAQYLEDRQAARELERCCAVKMRIATLEQKLGRIRHGN